MSKIHVLKDLDKGGFDLVNITAYKEDPTFSVAHNKKVLAETNKDNDKREDEVSRKTADMAGNVADILASYAKHRIGGSGTKKLEDYLGKEMLKKLYGEKLWGKLAMAKQIREDNIKKGNTLFGGNFYLPEGN